ncbi:probable S-adenosylmethionine decarboxylase proenzyme [Zygosaccharomyces bailii]|uniref:S-adenosylmethionine decarboxylase proenzyme n=1 Tax=Zygosaccharomyces bailii (strain CLIB 213 / ATCC 58445 / CBS 680 / BCRC 21525 / NBRC 1098 / NCYC 1416 / NRRL Y-2227) TaxID=1333698 RepID=A0A8J2T5G3_ZYGB2|nr:BN860_13586g1_1 [Zygosaccharomyces bailii CLIB 213]SJM82375.1 probable S-adenosylmethionine decarboxylase proenzyme [Zygosaccharomyces bailii]
MTVTINELINHTYIDKELSAALDSTEAFEGPEKLLEIWFFPSSNGIPQSKGRRLTLRDIQLEQWVEILKLVKCEVLSIKSTSQMNAFLLSESSLFVYDHKLTLKTCGTTTTLLCLQRLFDIVEKQLGWDLRDGSKYHPFKVFYSRRCFMFPMKQRSIHKSWSSEVEYLNQFFCDGRSYLVGRNDQSNHWNLYVTETSKAEEYSSQEEDETLEVLMTGLDPNYSKQFVTNREINEHEDQGHLLGYNITKSTKLDCLYDNKTNANFTHDAFAFTPCGYSTNMVIDDQYYYTIHVTPEKGWSYASFESNVPVSKISLKQQDNGQVLNNVLGVFQPAEFCLTFFAKDGSSLNKLANVTKSIEHYSKRDKIIYDLDDYQLLYMRFERI